MSPHKKPTILIVDDERSIRELIGLNLSSHGFEVFQAEAGRHALEIVADPDITIDLLITDILMPQMNGRELANKIFSIKPHIKVLFISAYSAEILTSHNLCPDGADFIKKPFTLNALLEKISLVWERGPKWKELVSGQA